MMFVPPPRPGTMAMSFSVRISRWISPAVTRGMSAMMMSAGQ